MFHIASKQTYHHQESDMGRQDLQQASYTCGIMPHRMVAAVVAKLELECFAAKGLAQELVSHANAKHGLLTKQLPNSLDSIRHCGWVALQTNF